MRVTCERCLRRYDVPDATVKGRKIRARCKCGARVVVQDEERAAKSLASGSHTTGSIQRPVRWFVDITSWEPIAMDLRQLVRAFDAGRVDADTLVWCKGMPDWRRLRDVPELADRLIGGSETTARLGSDPPAASATTGSIAGGVTGGSEPPPRQSERSRTPPASYTVGTRSSSEPPPGSPAEADAPAVEVAATADTAIGTRSVGTPSVATPSARPSPSVAPRPHSRRPRKVPSRPGASPAPLHATRTTTQMGLESPAEVVARMTRVGATPSSSSAALAAITATTTTSPTPATAVEADAEARSGAPSSGRARDARGPSPAAGIRRSPSSDETPAQKPSSVSVPPGAIVTPPAPPRGRRWLAIAAVVLGATILVKSLTSSSDTPARTATRHDDPRSSDVAAHDLKERVAPGAAAAGVSPAALTAAAVSPSGEPLPGATSPTSTPSGAATTATPGPVMAGGAAKPPALLAPTAAAVPHAPVSPPARVVEAPRPVAPSSPAAVVAPALPAVAAASAVPPRGVSSTPAAGTSAAASPAPAAAAAAPGTAVVAFAPTPAKAPGAAPATGGAATAPAAPPAPAAGGAAAAPGAATSAAPGAATSAAPAAASGTQAAAAATAAAAAGTAPAAPPSAGAAPVPVAPPPPVRQFDLAAATQQLETAAVKASACGSAGPTRGSGRVTISIEPWGRVARVTHLNQDFVGTPVGLCVMQAFQQIQVPPFDGSARAIAGAFMIQ